MKTYLSILLLPLITLFVSCDEKPLTSGGSSVTKKNSQVTVDEDGWTPEQKNIDKRLQVDTTPGAVKHLYIISPYSGQTILYSTVDVKVTSSGKRLNPTSVGATDGRYVADSNRGIPVTVSGSTRRTTEVLQDDGTYGSSCDYIYWWDTRGLYHQHFFTGGQIIHVSEEPLPVKAVIINLEQQ